MLARVCLAILVMIMVTGMAVGQSVDNSAKIAIKDKTKSEGSHGNPNSGMPAQPSDAIEVTSPNGEEVWKEGSIHSIEWKVRSGLKVDSVQISLIEETRMSAESGGNIATPKETLLGTVAGNPEKWVWEGVSPVAQQCRIKVQAFTEEKILIADTSDGTFTIASDEIIIDDPKPADPKLVQPAKTHQGQ